MLLTILLPTFTVTSDIAQKTQTEETIPITIIDMFSNTRSEHVLSKEIFLELFEPPETPTTKGDIQIVYEQKLDILEDNNILSVKTEAFLKNNLKRLIDTSEINSIQPQGALFDVVNLFNGVLFALKGEKTSSFFDLPVYQFPFFNDNITALFSGFSRYTGNGFIFTLGALGFQYAYDYNSDAYEFPYFPPVSGSIIGFTGVLLEADVGDAFGPQYEGFYSIGIGMNIFTLWNLE